MSQEQRRQSPLKAGSGEVVRLEHEFVIGSVNLSLGDTDVDHRYGWAAVVQHLTILLIRPW